MDPHADDRGAGAAERSHRRRTQLLARAIAAYSPSPGEDFRCPYLSGQQARHLTLLPEPLGPGVYHAMMDLNFRRLGPVFYRPQCQACDACRMIRVPVEAFRPSRAQRRCYRRNRDVSVETARPRPSQEKHALYRRYLSSRHDGQMDGSPVEFRGFLYESEVATIELTYRAEDRLLAVTLVDVEPLALSAVYCYFDPAQAWRSPGVFNVLWLIEECRRRGAPYLYLGYYVRDSPKMSYKATYRPHEILGADGRWVRSR